MDDAISFQELLENIAVKFREADGFFKNASVAISLEGRELTENQEREILDAITQNSRLNIDRKSVYYALWEKMRRKI